jgi:uncharacterized membrane protein (DUF373 family)
MYYILFISILHIAIIAPIVIYIYYLNNKIQSNIEDKQKKKYNKILSSLIMVLVILSLWGAIYHVINSFNIYKQLS